MKREEPKPLKDPETFKAFVIVTSGGGRYKVNHPDFIDLPPLPEEDAEEAEPDYLIVYNRASAMRQIYLANVAAIEFEHAAL
jgi:hypothetical protein